MVSSILRLTRFVVGLAVSLHVMLLRSTTAIADRKVAKCCNKVDDSIKGLEFARQAVTYARLSVRKFKDARRIAENDARNVRIAAEAEAQFYGRDL